MSSKSKLPKRSIMTSKPIKEIKKILKSVGVTDYSLKKLSGRKKKISLRSNLETCRRILQMLEE
jgi:hypothetical protein